MKNTIKSLIAGLVVAASLTAAHAAYIDFRNPIWNPGTGAFSISKSVDGIGTIKITAGPGAHTLTWEAGSGNAYDGFGVRNPSGKDNKEIDFNQWILVEFLAGPVQLQNIYLTDLFNENGYLEKGYYTLNGAATQYWFEADASQTPSTATNGNQTVAVNQSVSQFLLSAGKHTPASQGDYNFSLAALDVEAVPEPTTIGLMGLGLLGMGLAARRKKANKANA